MFPYQNTVFPYQNTVYIKRGSQFIISGEARGEAIYLQNRLEKQ